MFWIKAHAAKVGEGYVDVHADIYIFVVYSSWCLW